MSYLAVVPLVAACGSFAGSARDQLVIESLAEENYAYAQREPALVAMKLAKMQRDPFLWLRGTAGVFWRDLNSIGAERPATAFGSPASSRVLLVGDPHPENLGTFRAGDGTMLVDWNDFDSAGYGPYEGDVRRLAAGMIVAGGDATIAGELGRRVAVGYAGEIGKLASGQVPAPITTGAAPYLDKMIDKARANGDAAKDVGDYAPISGMARVMAFGDLDPVADDGVIENRLSPLDPVELDRVELAIGSELAAHLELGAIKGAGRRSGSGVASYPALRYYVLVEGATPALDDDRIVELKEERDGLVIHGVPELDAAEWSSPAARAVDAQRRLHIRPDADFLLGVGELAPLSFKIRDHAEYQRGVNATDLAAIVADPAKRDQIFGLAELFGRMLGRAHGQALTADGVPGWTVIAPLVSGAGFADEISAFAVADAAQAIADWQSMKDRELASLVLPLVSE